MKTHVPIDLLKDLADQLSVLEQEIKAIRIKIGNLYSDSGKEILVSTIRWVAPLAEVHRAGGTVTPLEFSWFCRKYGKNPKGAAGYFTGAKPSMRSVADGQRVLTEDGLARVTQMISEFGEEWLDRIPLDVVGNPEVDGHTLIYI